LNELDNLIEKLSTKTGGDLDTPTINADDLDAELAKILGDTTGAIGTAGATTAPETTTTWWTTESTTAEVSAPTVRPASTTSPIPITSTSSTLTSNYSVDDVATTSVDDVTNTSTNIETSTNEQKISKISEDPLPISPITTSIPR